MVVTAPRPLTSDVALADTSFERIPAPRAFAVSWGRNEDFAGSAMRGRVSNCYRDAIGVEARQIDNRQ